MAFFSEGTMAVAPKGSYCSDSFYFCSKNLILEAGVYMHCRIDLNINSFTLKGQYIYNSFFKIMGFKK